MIFDNVERDDHSVSPHREDEYSFLNRSARPAAAKVRALIETLSETYPDLERRSIKSRLMADFHPTFFELFMYAMLRHLGCDVEVHPQLNQAKRTKPDFLATFPSGEKVVIECVYPTDRHGPTKSEQARLNSLIDEINQVNSPDLCLHLKEVYGLDVRQPSTRRLKSYIQKKIDQLDADELMAALEQSGADAMPAWSYTDGEFSLEFEIWPKSIGLRGDGSNPIWAFPRETRWGGPSSTLKSVITEKVARYGEMTVPFLLAVNTGSFLLPRREDEVSALFGDAQELKGDEYTVPLTGTGAWVEAGGPKNTRLSAVMFGQIFPWNLSDAKLCLYHNPFAKRPCRKLPWQVPQAVPGDGKLSWQEGITIGSLFGLPPNWPGRLFE